MKRPRRLVIHGGAVYSMTEGQYQEMLFHFGNGVGAPIHGRVLGTLSFNLDEASGRGCRNELARCEKLSEDEPEDLL